MAARNIEHIALHQAPRLPAPWPHQVGVIPPQAAFFQNRAEIASLSAALADGGTTVVAHASLAARVIAGLGGIGKTQLAAHYARTAWQAGDLDVLVWVTAASASAVVDTYAKAAAELLGSVAPSDPRDAAVAFLAWLQPKARQRTCQWLIVLDDLADPADLNGLWPPVSLTGRTLVTTRRRDPALITGRCLVTVGAFTPVESNAYLTSVLAGCGRVESDAELVALADILGHLPLALAQAAAYLVDAGISTADYRARLADRAASLADVTPEVLPDGQNAGIAATWSLSIDRASAMRPVGFARPVLQLAAFMDANGIPEALLSGSHALAYLAAVTDRRGSADSGTATAEQVRLALRALHRLGLIEHTPADPYQAVRVHQLIQRAVRDTMTPVQRDQVVRIVTDGLLAAWPDSGHETDLLWTLRANTAALYRASEIAPWESEEGFKLWKDDDVPDIIRAMNRSMRVTVRRGGAFIHQKLGQGCGESVVWNGGGYYDELFDCGTTYPSGNTFYCSPGCLYSVV